MPGDHSGGVTPVPIPNTEVKPSNADDTASRRGGKVGSRQAFFEIYCFNAYIYLKSNTIISVITQKWFYSTVMYVVF